MFGAVVIDDGDLRACESIIIKSDSPLVYLFIVLELMQNLAVLYRKGTLVRPL